VHNSLLDLVLKNCDFSNTDISQGSVAACLGYVGIFKHVFVTESNSERISRIGNEKYFVKLWARVWCLVFDSLCSYNYSKSRLTTILTNYVFTDNYNCCS